MPSSSSNSEYENHPREASLDSNAEGGKEWPRSGNTNLKRSFFFKLINNLKKC